VRSGGSVIGILRAWRMAARDRPLRRSHASRATQHYLTRTLAKPPKLIAAAYPSSQRQPAQRPHPRQNEQAMQDYASAKIR
jgi:hypothetical protein